LEEKKMGDKDVSRLMQDSDVDQGLRIVGAELAQGRAGLYIGRGPGGFAVVAGAVGKGSAEVGSGHMVAVSLNEAGLRALRDRVDSLLRGDWQQAQAPRVIV
jgi:hypothetical protein